MIVRSNTAVSVLVEFPSGTPDGDVTWSALGPDGAVITSGIEAVPVTAVSVNLTVPAPVNALDVGEMTSYRDLVWSYTVQGAVVSGEQRYSIEGRVPFGVTPDGVRNKLGVQRHDVPDDQISLLKAYFSFADTVGDPLFAQNAYTDEEELRIRDAIEALAALELIPSMQVRIAQKESSGTDTYQRQDVDWTLLGEHLAGIVAGGILVVIPTFDLAASAGAIFILAPPAADPFTG